MAAPRQAGISRTEQEIFAQQKLEDLFKKTYRRLYEYRNAVGFVQEVLVWRRPFAAAVLYGAIHWVFVYFVKREEGILTQLFTVLFWALLGDALWRVATRPPNSGGWGLSTTGGEREREREREGEGRVRRESVPRPVSFDAVLLQAHTPKGRQELVSFEVLCLRVAEVLMWLDNCWLALKHWSVHDPVVFSVVLAVPGVVLSFLGKYIPTIVVAYALVMLLVVWPYVEYHGLLTMAVGYAHAHFPQVILQAKAAWAFVKQHAVSQEEELPPELALGDEQGDEESEARTRRGLVEAYERPSPDRPGMSLLQDSLLGLGLQNSVFPNPELDSLSTSSLALGPGDFPSISPSHQPHNPRQATAAPVPTPASPHQFHQPLMPIIEEEDDSQEIFSDTNELDPFTDSVEVEFGLNFADSRLARLNQQPAHRNVYANRPSAPDIPGRYGYREEAPGRAPPPYESVVDSSNGNTVMPPLYDAPHYSPGSPPYETPYPYYSPGYGGAQMPYHGDSLGFGRLQFPPGGAPQVVINPDPEGMIPNSSSTPLLEPYVAQGRELRHRGSDPSYQYH